MNDTDFLAPDELALLERVLRETTPASESDWEKDARAAALVNAYQSGIHCEAELVLRMSSRKTSRIFE